MEKQLTKEQIKRKEWYEKNKEKLAEYYKKYNKDNKEKIAEQRKGHRDSHKEGLVEKRKIYYEKNKEEIVEKNKIYRENNKEKVRCQKVKKRIKRQQNNPLEYRCSVFVNTIRVKKGDKDYFTKEYFIIQLTEHPYCRCCSKKLNIKYRSADGRNLNAPSIDRVDSNKGYVKDNVQIICWDCNRRKNSCTIKDLQQIIIYMKKYKKIAG